MWRYTTHTFRISIVFTTSAVQSFPILESDYLTFLFLLKYVLNILCVIILCIKNLTTVFKNEYLLFRFLI